jgi:hypothetical protein
MSQRPDTTQLSQYQYDPRSRRYRNRVTGQYLPAKTVRSAIDQIIDAETVKMRSLAQQLVDGEIALSDWQMQSAALLKSLHVAMGLAATGGLEQTSASDLGYIASQIKKQYSYLNKFAQEIKSGDQVLDGTLVARAGLYTQAGRELYENVVGRAARNAGCTQEKSNLGAADHCSDCVSMAAKGWQPIGTLIPIGSRQCKGNCRCFMQHK